MINELLKKLNDKYHFNSGGCCYVAYLIARELKGIKASFGLVVQSNSKADQHYCLYCAKFGLINPLQEYDNQVVFKASSETIKRIYDENEWSKKYDTKHNEVIAEEIRKIFNSTTIKSTTKEMNVIDFLNKRLTVEELNEFLHELMGYSATKNDLTSEEYPVNIYNDKGNPVDYRVFIKDLDVMVVKNQLFLKERLDVEFGITTGKFDVRNNIARALGINKMIF